MDGLGNVKIKMCLEFIVSVINNMNQAALYSIGYSDAEVQIFLNNLKGTKAIMLEQFGFDLSNTNFNFREHLDNLLLEYIRSDEPILEKSFFLSSIKHDITESKIDWKNTTMPLKIFDKLDYYEALVCFSQGEFIKTFEKTYKWFLEVYVPQNEMLNSNPEQTIEIDNINLIRKHQIGLFLALGIHDFLKEKFKIEPTDGEVAKLIAQLINETDTKKIDTIRTDIKNYNYKNGENFYSTPIKKSIEKIIIDHNLIDLMKKD